MRVLIVGNDAILNRRVRPMLVREGHAALACPWTSDLSAVAAAEQMDLIILDVDDVPFDHALDLCSVTRHDGHTCPFIVGDAAAPPDRAWLLEAGADAYFVKPYDAAELLAQAHALLRRRMLSSPPEEARQPTAATQMAVASTDPRARGLGVGVLTAREREVLTLVARGCRNAEITERLDISINTVEFHVRNILDKLDAQSRGEAIHTAMQNGLLRPADVLPIGAIGSSGAS